MTDNTSKFTGKADDYNRYRPSYPSEMINYLYSSTNAKTVADIGAGTGIFTKCLLSKSWSISAVEPNSDMLEKLNATIGEKAKLIKAPAEATTIETNSIDLITVAQAFHWFDKDLFKQECKRILTENGKLAIVWNVRCKNDFTEERDEYCKLVCRGYENGHVGKGSVEDGDLFLRNVFFKNVVFTEYDNPINYTLDSFIGDNLSRSYAPKEDEPLYHDFIKEMTMIFNKYVVNGIVEMPHKTTCYFGEI